MSSRTKAEYFALPDPTDPAQMTYWRAVGTQLTPWPPGAKYGPRLYSRDLPADLPHHGREYAEWVHRWYAEHRTPWHAAIRDAIETGRTAAMARFAAHTWRCCSCGRELTDPASKTYGVGPECRAGMPAELLGALAVEVGQVHALIEADGNPATFHGHLIKGKAA